MMKTVKIQSLNKHFNGIRALDDFSCEFRQSEILGLIGPNGAGKTTLFNVLTGYLSSDSGRIYFHEKRIDKKAPHAIRHKGIARTFQQLRLVRQMTLLENVMLAFQHQPGTRLGPLFFQPRTCRQYESQIREKARAFLSTYGLADKEQHAAGALSYGQQKLLSLICCLVDDPEVILLDEPVAGINPAMIEQILEILKEQVRRNKTLVMIEHNMDVISDLCDRVVFMDMGRLVSEGTPDEVKNDPKVIEAYLD